MNPKSGNTSFHFEYGTDTAYGQSTPATDAGAGAEDQPVTADLTGLTAGTTYHYRLVADNGTDPVQHGADGTFSTAPGTPASASEISAFDAMLHGVINTHGAAATYRFEYGADTTYGHRTPATDAGPGAGDQPVTAHAMYLVAGATNHFRVVVTINGQTTASDDATLTTLPGPRRMFATAPTEVTTTQATLRGVVDTRGQAATYQFYVWDVYGLSYYSTITAPQPVPAGDGDHDVSTVVTGLPEGEVYVVELLVTIGGTTLHGGSLVLFATLGPPEAPKDPCRDGNPDTCPFGVVAPGISNTDAIAVSNAFTVTKRSITGTTAVLTVEVPGPGKLQTTASHTRATTTTVTKAGTKTIKIKLTAAGAKALKKAKSRRLKSTIHIKYTPAGGQSANKTVALTFKR